MPAFTYPSFGRVAPDPMDFLRGFDYLPSPPPFCYSKIVSLEANRVHASPKMLGKFDMIHLSGMVSVPPLQFFHLPRRPKNFANKIWRYATLYLLRVRVAIAAAF